MGFFAAGDESAKSRRATRARRRIKKEVFILASRRSRRREVLALSRESGASGLVAKRVFHARRQAPGQPPSCASALTTRLALLAKLCLHRCDECRRGPQPYLHSWLCSMARRRRVLLAARSAFSSAARTRVPRELVALVVTRAKIKRGDVITRRRAGLAGRARRINGAGTRS